MTEKEECSRCHIGARNLWKSDKSKRLGYDGICGLCVVEMEEYGK